MIVGRNRTLNSLSQFTALKEMLKWRDFIARIEDESVGYVMPNHVLFQMCKDLPTTMNEVRDSCRANMTPVIMKYMDQIVQVMKSTLEKVKQPKGNHVKFEEGEKRVV